MIDDLRAAFVDVPGHERFVKTMLAGVGGIDCVMLVVAADESVMPQTREHFDICRLLHIPRGFVVLTKADLVDAETSELAALEVKDLVKGSFLEGSPIVPVSARTGAGLDTLRRTIAEMGRDVPERPHDRSARLPIDRAFSMQGFGTVVTGTLVWGAVHVDDDLVLLPGDRRVRVRGVQVHGKKQPEAVAGERTALNLSGVEVGEIARGQTLTVAGTLSVTRRLDAFIDLLESTRPLKHGARVRFHHGTAEVLGRVSLAGADTMALEPGARAAARIRLEAPVALTRGDRFVLRAYSPPLTIGGGEVLDPDPPRAGIRTTMAAARFDALALSADPVDTRALVRMVSDSGAAGLPVEALVPRAGVPPGRVAAVVQQLQQTREVQLATDRLVSSEIVK